jgi:archaemetzincin
MRNATRQQIALSPLGTSDESLLRALVPFLDETFGAAVTVAETIPLPEHAYNPSRRQYHSTVLLDVLALQRRRWTRQLGVADVDLYTSDLNFVFGEADSARGIAVFSTARLHSSDHERFLHRAATEAVHELGHTYGLSHCSNPRCVMWFSNTLAETDRKGTGLCDAHAEALRRAMNGVTSRR